MAIFAQAGCTNAACHGGALNPPTITSDAAVTYKAITSFTLSDGTPYVVSGGKPKDSGLFCNVRGDCGVRMPPQRKLDSKELDVIDEWLACGAPFN
jgi:hypothetical protein